jgi:hypothetical protein
MSASFSSRTCIVVDGQLLHATKGGDKENLEFVFNYCKTSVELFRKKRFVESRRAMSQACGLFQSILTAENPLNLEFFLHVLLIFVRGNMPEVVLLLGEHIGNIAGVCLPACHFLAKILRLLGEIGLHDCTEIILESWKCMTSMYIHGVGPRHQVSLLAEISEVKYCLTGQNINLAEQRYRDIQARVDESTDKEVILRTVFSTHFGRISASKENTLKPKQQYTNPWSTLPSLRRRDCMYWVFDVWQFFNTSKRSWTWQSGIL